MCHTSLLLSLAFMALCCSPIVIASSQYVWPQSAYKQQQNELDSISDLLVARGGSPFKSLDNARRIIQDLTSSPSCAYAPTARLLQQCKSIKPKTQDPSSDQQKTNVQATYGISMALCEARQAGIVVPPACLPFETSLAYKVEEATIQIVRLRDIESCLNSLFDTASWTTYVAFKSQSMDLCDSSRADYQREELLETFRTATEVVPDVLEALQQHTHEVQLAMEGIREMSADISESQRNAIAANHDQSEYIKANLDEMSQVLEHYIQNIHKSGQDWQIDLGHNLDQATQHINILNSQAGMMQSNFAELYSQAAEAVSGITSDFESSIGALRQQADGAAESILQLSGEEYIQSIRASMEAGRAAAAEFATAQTDNLEMVEKHISLGRDLLLLITESHGSFHHIKETLDLFPTSWFESLQYVRNTTTWFREELKYALFSLLSATLLLLIGCPRASLTIFTFYAFLRTVWSMVHTSLLSDLNMLVPLEDLKLLAYCTLGAIGAGGSVMLFFRFLISLLPKSRTRQNEKNQTSTTRLYSNPERMSAYTSQPSSMFKHSSMRMQVELGRPVRAQTVPLGLG